MEIEPKEGHKEATIVGFVREIQDHGKSQRVGITLVDEIYAAKLNEEGKNYLHEVSNKVEATGITSKTKDCLCRIDVSGYEIFEMDEDSRE